ncbi:S-adenosylmethionine decarboxylase proenzyme [Orenia metallireducens]|jgi:S-adenosylmethionine decarboxylase|uniref:S-adenosylmethionine decarboxylase proenzyme n=1 Tax=Orenia metallireducens TaxID=1413210 RepID=A0A1C0AAC2_9FIRM|nr:adenosylmethionine decarboxylase [Orenia metallireducens]OCL27235.1 S-adenosylmethionine decarboxylase proenzyme [Orenia metallireducens]
MQLQQLGRHILVEFYNCDSDILKSHKKIEEYMKQAAIEAKATIVQSVFHHFNPWGVSGAVVISESHLTIHTWPEYNYAAVDLFTCGGDVNPWDAFDYLAEKLGAEKTETTEVARGMFDKVKRFGNEDLEEIKFSHKIVD